MLQRWRIPAAGAGAALLGGIAVLALTRPDPQEDKPAVGLFTSLPIYWAESESIAETLNSRASPHWVRTALGVDYRLIPLDTVETAELGGLGHLVMAQPRPLAPAENVSLDSWVRQGGRLLLFADPMLTEHSRFMLGDKRRPQDVVLLSPILRRWGLQLEFDEDQPDLERNVPFRGGPLPVRLAGTFRQILSESEVDCQLDGEEVIARCAIGKGRVVVIADAALLNGDRDLGLGMPALDRLLSATFAD
jgi:hypothetical protein